MQAQGALAQVLLQMENTYKTLPTNVKAKKVYISDEGVKFSQELEESKLLRGAVRHPTAPVRGKVDVGGAINSELMAASPLFFAALGSVAISATGATVSAAMTTPALEVDNIYQLGTITATAHGVVVGDTVEMICTGTSPLTGTFYYPVVGVTSVGIFIIKLPMGVTGTITVTSVKKCTAGTFTYTYKAGGKLASYVVEKGYTDVSNYFRYLGMVCGKLGFSIGSTGLIPLTSEWMGASESVGATPLDAAPFDNGKASFDNLGVLAANVKVGGSAVADILGIDSISIDNQLDGDTFVVGGGGSRSAINPGIYGVSGTLKAMFQDAVSASSYYGMAKALTETSIDVTVNRGTGDGTLGNESLQMVIPEVAFKAQSPVISGPKGATIDLGFMGYYDNAVNATGFMLVVKTTALPGQVI